ncbi:MAG: tetratricopeptide repeat protein [Treponema sp.]|nr:tetratricopeptide repeat protein [Treponema sp.]
MKKLFLVVIFSLGTGMAFGQSAFARAEELFMQNKPADSRAYLEQALAEDPSNIVAGLYLGIVYEQLGLLEEASALYLELIERAGNLGATVANNLGNVFFRMGDFERAKDFYSQAIGLDRALAQARLGRANAFLQKEEFDSAILDYEQYLALAADSAQRDSIERLLQSLRMGAEQRAMEEQAARDAELQRLSEEQLRQLQFISAQLASMMAERQQNEAGNAARLADLEAEKLRQEERLAEIREEVRRQAGDGYAEIGDAEQQNLTREVSKLDAERQAAIDEEIARIRAETARLDAAHAEQLAGIYAEMQRMADTQEAMFAMLGDTVAGQIAEQMALYQQFGSERQQLLDEEMGRLDAERRRLLNEDIAASLRAAAERSRGLSTGPEGIEEFKGEFELE